MVSCGNPQISCPPAAGSEPHGIVFDVKRYSIHDGPGIRTTVFLKGCPLRCLWCHNPEAQDPQPEPIARRASGEGSAPSEANDTVGKSLSAHELMAEIVKDTLFYDESGGGVTISGGEPLMQPDFLLALLRACRARELHTAVDTCGFAPREVVDSIKELVDLFLFDLKLMDEKQHQRYTGASNRPILESLRFLAACGKRIVIRFPLVPDITDTADNLARMVEFLSALQINQLALLPYHKLGAQKYRKLRRANDMEGVDPPDRERIDRVRERFESNGIGVTVGG